jgi:hypothetical protein
MKKLLFLFLFFIPTILVSAKTLPAPGNGIYVLIDTNYIVGNSLNPSTEASVYYTNTTNTLVTGMQFRVFYDKVAFNGAAPTVALKYPNTDQNLQYNVNTTDGHITITLVYIGSNVNFNYVNSELVAITFTHAEASTFNNLTNISPLTVTGVQTFPAFASKNTGMDTTLNLYSYGGNFLRPTFLFTSTFTNVTGTGAKNVTIQLSKKPKTGSTWATVGTYTSGLDGTIAINPVIDTTYWDIKFAVQGDTMNVGKIISVADAQKVNQFVLGTVTPSGFDFYTADVNNSNTITISDVYSIFGRIAGRFSVWPNNTPDIKFFTAAEYTSINGSSTSLKSTIPGVTNFEYYINGTSVVTYYVAGLGDANGTGFKMARLVPIQILNPNNAPNYIIDQTVEYYASLDEIEINLPSLNVIEGNLINIPVKVYTNQDLGSLQLALKYDQNLLEFKGLFADEKPMTWLSFLNTNDGVVEWGGIDMSNNKFNLKNNEQVVTLQFTAKKPKSEWELSPLYVSQKYVGNANASDLNIRPTNGVIQIQRVLNTVAFNPNETTINVFPNPTGGMVTIQFNIPVDGITTVAIVDMNGRVRKEILKGKVPAGSYQYSVNLDTMGPGAYLAVLENNGKVISNKTILN